MCVPGEGMIHSLKWWNTPDRVQVINEGGGEEGDGVPGSAWCSRKEWPKPFWLRISSIYSPSCAALNIWPNMRVYVYTHSSVFISSLILLTPLTHTQTSKRVPQNTVFITWFRSESYYIQCICDWWSLLDGCLLRVSSPKSQKRIFSLPSCRVQLYYWIWLIFFKMCL